jgi:DNA-binding IscR family transcriptional regulator
VWGEVHLAIRRVFEQMTLADLAERHRKRMDRRPIFAASELTRPRT